MRKRFIVLLIPALVALTACGGGSSATDSATDSSSTASPSQSTPTGPSTSAPTSAPTTAAASPAAEAVKGALEGVSVTGKPGAEPSVDVAKPPYTVDQTTVQVLGKGTGDVTVKEGNRVQAQYLVVNGRTGETIDSSWSAQGSPASFDVSDGNLIPGLYQGLLGQQQGSRLAIAAPAAAAFGDAGLPNAGVEGGDTIIFVIDVEKVIEVTPPLAMAEGTDKQAPAGLPTLQTSSDGVPTGFVADAGTDPAPKDLVVAPVIVGDGPKVTDGQALTVHYLGQLYPDGDIFDQSWTRGQPFDFQIGAGNVIEGWDKGLIGQTVGSRVILAIPPDQAYGAAGSPPSIPADSTLIFVVDILAAS